MRLLWYYLCVQFLLCHNCLSYDCHQYLILQKYKYSIFVFVCALSNGWQLVRTQNLQGTHIDVPIVIPSNIQYFVLVYSVYIDYLLLQLDPSLFVTINQYQCILLYLHQLVLKLVPPMPFTIVNMLVYVLLLCFLNPVTIFPEFIYLKFIGFFLNCGDMVVINTYDISLDLPSLLLF